MAFVGLGVTGGIGAYKAVELARLLQQRGHRVQAVMTRAARRFVGPLTFEAITRAPVITGQFAPGLNAQIEHIALASEMDVLAVVPATANTLGKFAHGQADDFLSSLYLATRAPVLLAPAMNTHMWEHPSVRRNLAQLRADGVHIVDPGDGYLACGWVGAGRLAEPAVIADTIETLLARRRDAAGVAGTLQGLRVLVTAGPTVEDLDPVRFIGNRSTGRMGFAVAHEAARRGADVVLVHGPTTVPVPAGLHEVIAVRGAREMHAAVLPRAARADVIVMAAAVADYTPAGGALADKLEKGGALTVTFERTPDILAELGARRAGASRPVLVGFAAQTGAPETAARRKLETKRVDLVVANDVTASGAGFAVDTNIVSLVSPDGVESLPLLSKAEVAVRLLDRIERLVAASAPTTGVS